MLNKHPVLRLVAITALVLVFGALLTSVLNSIGQQAPSAAPTHAWMNVKTWKIIRLDEKHCETHAFRTLLEENPDAFVWVDLRRTDVTWQTICPDKRLFELDREAPLGPTLDDVLLISKKRAVIFNVHIKDSHFTAEFLKIITDAWPGKTDLAMASPSQAWLRDIRKKHPEWMYVADVASWGKLKFMDSIRLPTIVELWPDIFVASLNPEEPNTFTLSTATEIVRRKKVLLVDWDGETPADPEWDQRSMIGGTNVRLRGILTKRPKNPAIDTFLQKMAE